MQPSDSSIFLVDPPEGPGETVADGIYRRLIEAILFGDLAASRRLILQELADRFEVSLTPVREALQRLAAEGFIEATPRRGYRIRTPSPRHVAELWQVRLGLELNAGELAIAAVMRGEGGPFLRRLEEIQRALDARGDLTHRRHIELNALFHQTLVEASGNRLLATIYHGIQMQLLGAWVQRGLDGWRARLASESAEHTVIINALIGRDATALTTAIRLHLGRSLDGALRDIAAQGEAVAEADKA
ncbi:GntR family transcriptional regulator [Bosea sp. UC22_33]|uniref:GntR family transcriptional regulator n=1 Tax=Bosea sp. UC22_33 TaxID=3350165 RepID=UPI003673036F